MDESQVNLCEVARNSGADGVRRAMKDPNLDVNRIAEYARTPLHGACIEDSYEVARVLLEHPNIDVNVVNKFSRTPLHYACCPGYVPIVELLLARDDIDVNRGRSSLLGAARNEHLGIVKMLLKRRDIGVDDVDEKGWNTLTHACNAPSHGLREVIRVLARDGRANINYTTAKDAVGLQHAASVHRGASETVFVLLMWWADLVSSAYPTRCAQVKTGKRGRRGVWLRRRWGQPKQSTI